MRTHISMRTTFVARSVLALLVLATACGKKEPAPAASAADSAKTATVLSAQDIATAESRVMGAGVTVSGSVEPAEVVRLTAQIAGTVGGVRVDRGSQVARGQVLAVIEAQGVRSQAAGAEAQVAAARAQLGIAQQRLVASKRLLDAGAISAIEYRTAQANQEAAEAQLAAARAQSAGANESAAHTTVRAPISGVISARGVSGGEPVSVGADLFTVVNASELELAGQVGVQEASRVRSGQAVAFTLDAYPNQSFRGRVARVDPTSDPGTGQVGVYVRLPNPGNRIVGGQFARGRIETGGTTTAVTIPESALTNRTADTATVYVIAGNKASRRKAVLGARDETSGTVAVLTGISAGEKVLINPPSDIGEGTRVTIAADKPVAAPR